MIVFDLSGVFFNNGLKEAIRRISEEYQLEPKIIEFVLNGSFAEKYRIGTIGLAKFWKNAKEYLKVEDIEGIKKIFFESYYPHPESVELLKNLRNKNFKLGYISNGPQDRSDFLDEKYGFISLFDLGLFSFEAHVRKPDVKIYRKFIEKFNLNPEEIIYIDDAAKNLVSAKEVGMNIILFQTVKDLENKLNEFGIDI